MAMYPPPNILNDKFKKLNIDKLILDIVNEIKRSGKPIENIPKEGIFSFLQVSGVDRTHYENIYSIICDKFKNVPTVGKPGMSGPNGTSGTIIQPQYDKELKSRIPRKSVFSEIKKL